MQLPDSTAISKGGTLVVTGMASHHSAPGIPVSLLKLAGFEKRIQGCLFGMCSPAVDILRQIDLYRSGRLRLDELITRRYPLDDINDAVADLLEGRTSVRGSSRALSRRSRVTPYWIDCGLAGRYGRVQCLRCCCSTGTGGRRRSP